MKILPNKNIYPVRGPTRLKGVVGRRSLFEGCLTSNGIYIILVFSAIFLPYSVFASNVYIDTSHPDFFVGDTIMFSVRVDSENKNINAATDQEAIFSAEEWNAMDEKAQQELLMHYRLAYLSDTMVNWCPELGTVLANDEVKESVIEMREDYTYGIQISVKDEAKITELKKICKELIDITKEIVYK